MVWVDLVKDLVPTDQQALHPLHILAAIIYGAPTQDITVRSTPSVVRPGKRESVALVARLQVTPPFFMLNHRANV